MARSPFFAAVIWLAVVLAAASTALADLWVCDLASGKNAQVPISLPSDRLQVREKFVHPMASLLAPYGNPDALAVAQDLDSKIEQFLRASAA